ncbi:DUF481 domain-containing protein [Sulfurimonas sp.]
MKFLIILLLSIVSAQAVIYIAPVDIGDKPGFSGSLKGSFQTKRGNTNSDEYSAGSRFQYDNNKSYVLWTDIAFSYAKASGTANTNKTYVHVRYIHSFYKKHLNWEAFVQSQTDKFTKIQKRFLGGIGLRYHSNIQKYGNIYFGFGFLGEHIDYTTKVDPTEDNVRLNLYIAYKKDFSKNVHISYLGYYQPNTAVFSDYILSNSAQLRVKIYKQLSINFELIYNKDTKPAVGVQNYDFSQKTSFIYEF